MLRNYQLIPILISSSLIIIYSIYSITLIKKENVNHILERNYRLFFGFLSLIIIFANVVSNTLSKNPLNLSYLIFHCLLLSILSSLNLLFKFMSNRVKRDYNLLKVDINNHVSLNIAISIVIALILLFES